MTNTSISSQYSLKEESNQDNMEQNSAQNRDFPKYAVSDIYTTPPPDFKSKFKRFLYSKGMGPRPSYMQEIYDNTPRYVYFNYDLPENMLKEDGTPIMRYSRNKIRTTKYTPLSFLPKNLLLQFTNVANILFLFIDILGAFQVFGVPNPAMAATPLIVIVCITAIKDAVEDYGRTVSDSELNNSPIHLLQGVENPNVLKDNVGPWRRFKKKCTRMTIATGKGIKKACIMVFAKKETKSKFLREEAQDYDNALRRISTVQSDHTMTSRPRQSHHSHRAPSTPLPNSLLNPQVIQEQRYSKFKNRCWKDVSVGDIIRIRADEEIPADVVILSTSDSDGVCFVETKNLDGETNLKSKSCLSCGGNENLKHAIDVGNTKFWIECSAPNANLYDFKGTVHYENYNAEGELVNPDEKESIGYDNVLLRGCTLRNTAWAVGVVVYTGSESKIVLNSGITPTKTSRISRELNFSVIMNFVLLFILSFVSAVVNGLFYKENDTSRLFFEFHAYGSTPAVNGVIAFFVTLIIYQSIIPISLYISIEIIKTAQAFFIYSDIKMYHEELDFPCIAKAWNMSDDLGQIEYIFSDKTGTLTQNVMDFKKCTIRGKSYGLAYTEAKQGLDKREGVDIIQEREKWNSIIAKDKEAMLLLMSDFFFNNQLREDKMTFVSSEYVKDILNESEQKSANERFMRALALCHTVVTEENAEDPTLRDYKAESPDEAALVSVARDLGITFTQRSRKTLYAEFYGVPQEYELLQILPFNSTRKRMSCILRKPDGGILLLCKGADNVIYERLDPKLNSSELINKTALHLEEYAKEGLRTLCIAEKDMDESFYNDWIKRYNDACSSIEENRHILIDELHEEVEHGLELLGGTAIEDKLQNGVPDSIEILGNAGIKLWVLTGDRIETAINIGFSCNLLGNDMQLLVVRPDENNSPELIDNLLTRYLTENFNMDLSNTDRLIQEAKLDHSTPSPRYALIIDGMALNLVFNPEFDHLRKKFLLLGKQCKAVICCRVSPAQKAEVVLTVKNNLNVMTLAIGDGANDVAMIQAANIGIGIAGKEGRQAVMSSDYAIGQFRFLTRLLLVHGRWSYKRLAEMIPCFFYKNVVFTLTCFWYGIYNNFDGSYLYEYTFLMFYNLAFTSLPVIFMAVLDQDVSDTISLLTPQLYRSGILGKDWSQYKFGWYMFDGLYQSVISYFFPYLLYYVTFQNPEGLGIDHRYWIGTVAMCISVGSVNTYIMLHQYRWDWLSLLITGISILLVYFWTGAWSARIVSQQYYKAGAQVLGTLGCWCCIFIGMVASLLPRFVYDFYMTNFKPKDIDIIRERVRKGAYADYPDGYDPTDQADIEKYRFLRQIVKDPVLLEKLENELGDQTESVASKEAHNPLSRTFKSIKRHATINRSRKNSTKAGNEILREHFLKPININELRQQMIDAGELNARTSLDRISTTHELPGLTKAETLVSYHKRNSAYIAE